MAVAHLIYRPQEHVLRIPPLAAEQDRLLARYLTRRKITIALPARERVALERVHLRAKREGHPRGQGEHRYCILIDLTTHGVDFVPKKAYT